MFPLFCSELVGDRQSHNVTIGRREFPDTGIGPAAEFYDPARALGEQQVEPYV